VDIQRLSLMNINPNKPSGKAKPAKPAVSTAPNSATAKAAKEPTLGEVLISVSSTVADSNGIDLADSHLSFAVDLETGSTVINIIDDDTGEVIRQIPPDDILKLKTTMGGEMQGLVVDRKA